MTPDSDDSTFGPSNSSDSGSDRSGATRQPGMPDPLTPVDKAMREDAPRSPLPEQVMSIETDNSGATGEITPEPDPEPDEEREDEKDRDEHEPAEHEPHPTAGT